MTKVETVEEEMTEEEAAEEAEKAAAKGRQPLVTKKDNHPAPAKVSPNYFDFFAEN